MKKLVMFDCFGVLVSPISYRWFEKHFARDVLDSKYTAYFAGINNGERCFINMINALGEELNMTFDEIINEWMSLVEINFSLLNEIKILKKHCKTCLLSNAGNFIIEEIFTRNNLDFSDYYDKVFISSYYHLEKPHFRFYKLGRDAFKMTFDEVIMIDDRIENLEKLPEIGITPILMDGNEKLFPKLKELSSE